jgi:hypothetical protein
VKNYGISEPTNAFFYDILQPNYGISQPISCLPGVGAIKSLHRNEIISLADAGQAETFGRPGGRALPAHVVIHRKLIRVRLANQPSRKATASREATV